MDLTSAVQTLSSEMGLYLELGKIINLDEDVTGTRLSVDFEAYGKIVLMTKDNGDLLMAEYEGKYPNMRDSEGGDKICLDLDTFSIGEARSSNLRRLDGHDLPFLGIPADRWNAEREEPVEGRGRRYLERL